MTLELPPDLEQRVREAAERGGFSTAQAYLVDLLEQAIPSVPEAPSPASRRRRSRRKASLQTEADEEAALSALLPGEGEIPPPIPLSEIRGVRHDIQLVREMRGGHPYEYYPVGDYIVAAPGVCGGRLTFKYTRLDARHLLAELNAGHAPGRVHEDYSGRVPLAGIEELLHLSQLNPPEVFERSVVVDSAA
jgi:uncharacterized protein (DUF433 family)